MQSDYTIDWLVNKYTKFFEKFGLGEDDLRTHYEEWKVKSGNESVKDYLWYLFQVLLGETAKQVNNDADLHKNNFEIYSRMWEFRVLVEGQKDNQLVQLREESRVRGEAGSLPFESDVEIVAGHCCPACDALHEKVFTIEDVLQHHYIGATDCTREWGCNCRYQLVPRKDADGNAILKEPE